MGERVCGLLVDHRLSLKTKVAQSCPRSPVPSRLVPGRWLPPSPFGLRRTPPKARVAPSLVGRLFVGRFLRCRPSVCSPALTASGSCQPQSAELVARSRGWTCGPTLALRGCKKEDAHPRLRYWWFVELVHPRVSLVINAPEKEIQPPSSGTFSKGCLSRKLLWQCASPHLAPLAEEDFGANDSDDARDRVYAYDGIGNREKSDQGTLSIPTASNYVANLLNEYTTVEAVSPNYDDDGNATAYPLPANVSANATLVWDAENRLISATLPGGVNYAYEYDYRGRRISKTNSGITTRYLYEGWNLCAEYAGSTLSKTYTWGMDLSGSMQGAGGVGGLLMVSEISGSGISGRFYPTYDGNGNVSEYLNSAGASVAHYEYDAFGNQIAAATSGAKSADFSHRFSTKYLDETGLYYYGYRYYDPVTGLSLIHI